VNARELIDAALQLRDSEGLLDVAVCVTTGRRTKLLWLSKGQVRRELKGLLRRGIPEAFILISQNGHGWKATVQELPGIERERAEIILANFARADRKKNGMEMLN
jgi:hypothetical protein